MSDEGRAMKIGELARRARVPASTIRFYETIGLLAAPPRRSGRRVYEPEVVTQLRAIAALQYAGFSLAEIRELVPALASGRAPGPRWERAARDKLRELDATIHELRGARRVLARAIDCACGGSPDACELVAGAERRRASGARPRDRARGVRHRERSDRA
ncbi:MAG: MerR family transcriptional regulator [Sandaracinaceae bacterium]